MSRTTGASDKNNEDGSKEVPGLHAALFGVTGGALAGLTYELRFNKKWTVTAEVVVMSPLPLLPMGFLAILKLS